MNITDELNLPVTVLLKMMTLSKIPPNNLKPTPNTSHSTIASVCYFCNECDLLYSICLRVYQDLEINVQQTKTMRSHSDN